MTQSKRRWCYNLFTKRTKIITLRHSQSANNGPVTCLHFW